MSTDAKIAERLLAHAALCRRIARRSWSEETAVEVTQFADDCARAAAIRLPRDGLVIKGAANGP